MSKARDIADSTKTLDVDGGTIKLNGNYPVGTGNVALGDVALSTLSNGAQNTAIGNLAGATTNAAYLTAVGYQAARYNTGDGNTAIGTNSLITAGSGTNNVAVGKDSLYSNTTANNNSAAGFQAGYSNTTGSDNVFFGFLAGKNQTTASSNIKIGPYAGHDGNGVKNCFIGRSSGYYSSGSYNTFVGRSVNDGAGGQMTTGAKNTILGGYSGNQGGLDIRTTSNNIVLSDGDGNPAFRAFRGNDQRAKMGINIGSASSTQVVLELERHDVNHSSCIMTRHSTTTNRHHIKFVNSAGEQGYIVCNTSSVSYVTNSDHRLKENVVELTGATDRLKQLNPSRFNFIADADTTVDGFLAHEVQAVVPEAITGTKDAVDADGNPVYQGIDQSKLVPLLVATIQELEARITALENA